MGSPGSNIAFGGDERLTCIVAAGVQHAHMRLAAPACHSAAPTTVRCVRAGGCPSTTRSSRSSWPPTARRTTASASPWRSTGTPSWLGPPDDDGSDSGSVYVLRTATAAHVVFEVAKLTASDGNPPPLHLVVATLPPAHTDGQRRRVGRLLRLVGRDWLPKAELGLDSRTNVVRPGGQADGQIKATTGWSAGPSGKQHGGSGAGL